MKIHMALPAWQIITGFPPDRSLLRLGSGAFSFVKKDKSFYVLRYLINQGTSFSFASTE
ncbi:MAG: hypothetical protein HKN76_07920 [Saprospiraceae bacterium]|nr:hypothetical protein [Saprospiraceae bacterium]